MNSNNKKLSLDLLGQIHKVDAPPFLFTRIKQRIENTCTSRFSLKLTWSIGLSFILVLALNFMVINKRIHQIRSDNTLVNTFNLMPDNSLYK